MSARDDLDGLLDLLLPLAQEQLAAHGELLPVAATMSSAGEVAITAAQPETGDATAADAAELLVAGLRAQAEAGELRAVGVCTDVRLGESPRGPTDALRVALEHVDGDAADVYLPYEQHGPRERAYGELFAFGLEPSVFAR